MQLTTNEYNIGYNKCLQLFAEGTYKSMIAEWYTLQQLGRITFDQAKLLWLYSFALNTWDNTPGAVNYLTETQVVSIIARVHEF